MKKKLLTLTIVLTVILLGAGIFTTFASNSGYDSYKEALKETHKIKSANADIHFTISDNDKIVQDVTIQSVYNLNEERMKANINLKTAEETSKFEVYSEASNVYIDNGESTFLVEKEQDPTEQKEKFERYHNKELLTIAELVFDTVTNPLHDSVVIDNDNNISVQLTNDDLPVVIHKIGSYMVKNGLKHHSNIEMTPADYPFLTDTIKQQFPTLTDEINFNEIKINAKVTDEGFIENQQAYFNISGKDEDGQLHTLKIEFKMNIENINDTTVTPFNLDGKTVETIQLKKVHHFH